MNKDSWKSMRARGCSGFLLLTLFTAAQAAAQTNRGTGLPRAVMAAPAPNLSEPAAAVEVHNFRFFGNTVFTSEELTRVIEGFRYQLLTMEDLENARAALTRHYVEAGYINSGALLENQRITDHDVTFRIIEGTLADVKVEGNKRLRTRFIESRVRQRAGPPLNAPNLEEALLILKDNPNIQQINAELKPDAIRGQALLDVRVKEANPWQVGLQARNDRPPSVGAEVLELLLSHKNVTGNSDAIDFRYGILQRTEDGAELSGADNLGVAYTLPISARDTTLQAYYNRNDYSVIEEPFDDLDIDSESSSYGVALRQPLYRTYHREFAVGLIAERRESKTFLLDEPMNLSPGAEDGESTSSALRFFQEWIERRQSYVLGLRSTIAVGVDVFNASDDGTDRDGQFFTWMGQGQFLYRLGRTPHQFVASTVMQWSTDPLLSVEQFAIGGANTVRGYRENQLVRDTGIIVSAEFQFAILTDKLGFPTLQLAPFYDFGAGWNVDSPTPDGSNLMSAGLGVIYHPNRHFQAKVYWGYPFRDFDTSGDLQDAGIHFRVTAFLF